METLHLVPRIIIQLCYVFVSLCVPLQSKALTSLTRSTLDLTLHSNLLAPHIANHAGTFRLPVRPKPKSVPPPLNNVETKVKTMENC
jgi:hypothetical protein